MREEGLLQVRCGPIPDDGDDEGPIIIIPLRLAQATPEYNTNVIQQRISGRRVP